LFDDNYKERYINEVCIGNDCYFDNLPVIDGMNWSLDKDNIAGVYPVNDEDNPIYFNRFEYMEMENTAKLMFYCYFYGLVEIELEIEGINVKIEKNSDKCKFAVKVFLKENNQYKLDGKQIDCIINTNYDSVNFKYNNYNYKLKFDKGFIENKMIKPSDGKISLKLKNNIQDKNYGKRTI
jgi:hypothetical protein